MFYQIVAKYSVLINIRHLMHHIFLMGPSRPWSLGFITTYAINTYHSNVASSNPLRLDTTVCDKVCQWLATGRWFSIAVYAVSAYHHKHCEFESRSGEGVPDTTLCDKVCQWLATCRCFSPVSSTNKTVLHDITEIVLKVKLNTIDQS